MPFGRVGLTFVGLAGRDFVVISITPIAKGSNFDQLQLDLTAKTYRYLDDDEVAAAEADKRKADAAKRHGT